MIISNLDELRCLNASDGAVLWRWKPKDGGHVAAVGGVDEGLGLIFVGTLSHIMHAVNYSAGGTSVWEYNAGAEIWATHGPLVLDKMLCFGAGERSAAIASSTLAHCFGLHFGTPAACLLDPPLCLCSLDVFTAAVFAR